MFTQNYSSIMSVFKKTMDKLQKRTAYLQEDNTNLTKQIVDLREKQTVNTLEMDQCVNAISKLADIIGE